MKEVKAFVHRHCVSDLLRGLRDSGFERVSVFDVKGTLHALSAREQRYSVELGEPVVEEMQIELCCDDAQVAGAVEVIRRHGRTGRADAGWIYVSGIEQAIEIGGEER